MDILACSLVRMVFHGAMHKQTLRLPKIPTNTRNPKGPKAAVKPRAMEKRKRWMRAKGLEATRDTSDVPVQEGKDPGPRETKASTSGFSVHVVGVQLLANTVLLASLPRCVAVSLLQCSDVVKFTKGLK